MAAGERAGPADPHQSLEVLFMPTGLGPRRLSWVALKNILTFAKSDSIVLILGEAKKVTPLITFF